MRITAAKTVSVSHNNEVSIVEGEIFDECVLNYEKRTVSFIDRRGKQACFPFEYFKNIPGDPADDLDLSTDEPVSNKIDPNGKVWLAYGDKQVSNLTIRGIFAAIAMLGQSDNDESPESIADTSVKIADALINRLNRDVE